MSPPHVAILHFTASPAVGGVENLIDAQVAALQAAEIDVTLVVGEGGPASGATVRRVGLLSPARPEIAALGDIQLAPGFDHPAVRALESELGLILSGVDQVWVHNAFSTNLNPAATVALHALARRLSHLRWVAWCEDVSAGSDFVTGPDMKQLPENMEIVTISEARKADIVRIYGGVARGIQVIPPPLDAPSWLDLGAETQRLADLLALFESDPLILVPTKLLPHKGLDRIVALAVALKAEGRNARLVITGAASPHQPQLSQDVLARLKEDLRWAGVEDGVMVLAEVLGSVPRHRTIRDLMLLSDLVLLPSDEEGYGMPLLEAAALRVPILCTDIPAFREVGGSAATYFSLDASGYDLAASIIAISGAPANRLRRGAINSLSGFRHDIVTLARGQAFEPGRAPFHD